MEPLIRHFGLANYSEVWQQMCLFTDNRTDTTPDEIWIVQHPPVYTLGQQGKREHLLNIDNNIPVIQTDRGGQVTYHGPGQIVIYPLLNCRRLNLGIRQLVTRLEQSIIQLLSALNIQAETQPTAPGVYVQNAKIASLGLRIRRGCCYHGLALNVAMDLSPFTKINPCGMEGLKMTQIKEFVPNVIIAKVENQLIRQLVEILGYNPRALSFRDLFAESS